MVAGKMSPTGKTRNWKLYGEKMGEMVFLQTLILPIFLDLYFTNYLSISWLQGFFRKVVSLSLYMKDMMNKQLLRWRSIVEHKQHAETNEPSLIEPKLALLYVTFNSATIVLVHRPFTQCQHSVDICVSKSSWHVCCQSMEYNSIIV
jgi:hypothetical protein